MYQSNIVRGGLMTLEAALSGKEIPSDIRESLAIVDIRHLSFEGDIRTGQLVIDKRLEGEVVEIFSTLLRIGFPIARMVPVVAYGWDDDASMADNNSAAFNYRFKTGKEGELSEHGRGTALDLNPMQNPFIGRGMHCPPGAIYDSRAQGTLTGSGEVVALFKSMGWIWGGDWVTIKDYQHFEKPL